MTSLSEKLQDLQTGNVTSYYKGLYGHAKYFWIVFTIKLKRNKLRHELKKYMLKQALISL
jgi:hypothetical protein